MPPRRMGLAQGLAVETRGLTKTFGGINAVTDVSFTVHEHEILGLIGPNGAGKTTIFDMISGHLPSNSGRRASSFQSPAS